MTKRPFLVKTAAIANAILLVVAFVGCPARKRSDVIGPQIAPAGGHFMPPPIATAPADVRMRLPEGSTAAPSTPKSGDPNHP